MIPASITSPPPPAPPAPPPPPPPNTPQYSIVSLLCSGPSLMGCWVNLLEAVAEREVSAELAVFVRAGQTGIPREVCL